MAKVPSPRVPPHVLERVWSWNGDSVAPASTSVPSLGTEIHDSVVPWLDGDTPLPHSAWGYGSNHLVPAATSPPFFERPVQPLPQDFVSRQQGERYFQSIHHLFPSSPDQHIAAPVYGQQEQPFRTSFPSRLDSMALDSMALVQRGSHVYSTGPEQPVAVQDRDSEPHVPPAFEQCASLALESPLPPFSSLRVAQEQFTFQFLDHVPLFQFSDDTPRLGHRSPTAPPARPETSDLTRSTDGYTTTAVSVPYSISQDESSYLSSQPVPFDAPPQAVSSTNYYSQSPISSSPLLQQRHFPPPFSDLDVTGTFTFDISQVIPYFDFSPHVPPPPSPPPPPPPQPDGIAIPLPRDPQVMSDARPPIPANRECPSRQMSFDQGVQSPQTPIDPASQPQEDVVNLLPSQPPTPVGQADSTTGGIVGPDAEPSPTGAIMSIDGTDDDDDESGSDSNSDMDPDSNSSDDDSDDSDSDSESSEDESDAMATDTEIVCKTSSSRASEASSKAQDVVLRVPADKDSYSPTTATTKDDETDSDSDSSDGYFEHVSTPATTTGASNDDDSSSDEDMSDHEEEYRLYWEMFYTPRHRRPPQLSVESV